MMMSQPPRRNIDKSRWPLLSPLLDELLDLAPEQRPARLGVLEDQDPELAADLRELLWRQDAMDAANYLATPALQSMEAQPIKPSNSAGQQIGAYTLEREVGQGGMGTVWLARRTDGRFEGLVAIKFLNAGLLGRGDAGRFAREGQILARLAHPHIARLLDAGIAEPGEQPYLVLEYVDGLPLDRYCETQALKARERVALFQDVLAAVAHAHTRLILHRDLKPSNILVTSAGEVKLLDFGIAKLLHEDGKDSEAGAATELTRQAGRAFTPRYAAPEQVQGGEVSTATDVYALGVLLYLLLSGQHPTDAAKESEQTTPLERMRTLVEVAPKKLSDQVTDNKPLARELRGDLDTIVAKALKKLPAERYANAAELAEDLRRWFNHEPISARPDSAAYIFAKFVRRHRVAVAAASLGLVALSASVGVALRNGQEAQAQRIQAEGLIEFMLGDLRKKLEPVGRLDVLDAVGEKALGYYAQQQLGSTDADALGRRARALHLMGEIAEKRGRRSEALAHFNEAAKSTAELLARAPADPQRLFDHGQSVFWVGMAARQQGDTAKAMRQFERYLALSEQLVKLEPGKLDWQIELGYAHNNLGVMLLDNGMAAAALPRLENARTIWLQVLPKNPGLRSELSNTLGWLATAQEDLGQLDASIQSHQDKLKTLADAASKQKDRDAEERQAAALTALSRLHLHAGRAAISMETAHAGMSIYGALSGVDPENLALLSGLAFGRMQLIDSAQALAKHELAHQEILKLGEELRRLLAADDGKPAWALRLQGRWLAAASLDPHGTEPPALMRAKLQQLMGRYPPVLTAGQPPHEAASSLVLALAGLRLGDAWAVEVSRQAQAQDLSKAKSESAWHSVLLHLEPFGAEARDPRVICLRALALLRLGRTQEARALAETLKASTSFRHPVWLASLAGATGNK
ncbi:MAG: protein kinase [Paucibacter sp.]|nr:protein kinase [Roseateles sp.]